MANLWRIYCTEPGDEGWQYVDSDTEITECPNDPLHSVNPNSISKVSESQLVIVEEHTDGDFETEHVAISIPSGSPGDVTEHDVVWPMDILLWKTILKPTSDMIGDVINVRAAPETVFGQLTSPASIGDTVLNVNPDYFSKIRRGYGLTLYDGVNKNFLDRITAIDVDLATITVQTALSNNFAAGTWVSLSIYTITNLYITDTDKIDIAAKGLKGKILPAGVIMRIYYTNNSGTAKSFRWRPEFYNDG